ncbi:MAG TPA: DJ-1/PfpI family protein [Polyangiaceae bacterium]|nr:DJ-1/PfpI family protein [Polyangiaceae bacterium]
MYAKIAMLVGVALLIGAGIAVFAGSSAPYTQSRAFTPVPSAEHARTIAAMKPPKRARPVAAVIAENSGTETTDYLVPYSVLAESGVVEVVALATQAGPVKLVPALRIEPQSTTAAFDARYPDGADYVIVPKIEDTDNAAVVTWIKAQAAKGAMIVGVCNGVKTVSAAGLLENRSATGHWYDIGDIRKQNPSMRWVRDRRYVVDHGVVTTTGVTASLPVSLALVEAIAGSERAALLAEKLGVKSWDARHDSASFALDWSSRRTTIRNTLAFWDRQTYGVPVSPGVDEIALAFAADAWSRTYQSQALAIADRSGPIRTRRGLTLLPDAVAGERRNVVMLSPPSSSEPAHDLPAALEGIAARHGMDSAAIVALQLEYPWSPQRR